ncbi:CAP domain-containing protein [Arthrobacter sp. TWP1-1]|uniref:CAP domain-containing protein n=1 Tax=Arthrobacter sp. TWP1-1 TaxID=2804568 RepID=UPI003CEF6FE2
MHKTISLLSAAILAATLLIVGSSSSTAATPKDPFVAKVMEITNAYRAENGAPPVVFNEAISLGSQAWAKEINNRINAGTLNMTTIHRSDSGLSILPKGPDMYSEIIGINNNAQQIVDWWMASPAHRAALLNPRATDMGVGQVKTTKYEYGSMTVVVANIAGYATSRLLQPTVPEWPKPPVDYAYAGHVQNEGWQSMVANGLVAGTVGRSMRLEALNLSGSGQLARAHVQDEGWMPWQNTESPTIGTVGKSKRMEAIQLKSTMPNIKFRYRVHVQNIGWMPWVNDGEVAGTVGQSLRIEAVEIRVVNTY